MASARPKVAGPARAVPRAVVEIAPARRSRLPSRPPSRPRAKPTLAQRGWLVRGLIQPGGKLPLFDRFGQRVNPRTIRCCIEQGWAEPWFSNPLKRDWLVCRLTEKGKKALEQP